MNLTDGSYSDAIQKSLNDAIDKLKSGDSTIEDILEDLENQLAEEEAARGRSSSSSRRVITSQETPEEDPLAGYIVTDHSGFVPQEDEREPETTLETGDRTFMGTITGNVIGALSSPVGKAFLWIILLLVVLAVIWLIVKNRKKEDSSKKTSKKK